jgi:hypothetical protein
MRLCNRATVAQKSLRHPGYGFPDAWDFANARVVREAFELLVDGRD